MYLVFTRMPGESYRRRLGSLLLYLYLYIYTHLCSVFRALFKKKIFLRRIKISGEKLTFLPATSADTEA